MIKQHIDEWGRVTVKPESVAELILKGIDVSSLAVEPSPIVDEYNQWCMTYDKPDYLLKPANPMPNTPEEEHKARSSIWFISDDIRNIDVRSFLLELCNNDQSRVRVNAEMDLFEERDLIPLLQLMIYLVDYFRTNKIIWGVGRGSSVASYVLFLIGVHRIDSLRYGLDIHDFLK